VGVVAGCAALDDPQGDEGEGGGLMAMLSNYSDAVFSPDGRYRYLLTRGDELPVLGVIMLNPSTADAKKNDPTISRLMRFAESWGYGSLLVANLYGFFASKPQLLDEQHDPYGLGNPCYLMQAIRRADLVLVAWGRDRRAHSVAIDTVVKLTHSTGKQPYCLGTNADGSPVHPQARGKHRVPNTAKPVLWEAK
jgi:hypothetical protein